jgi:thermitase
MGNAIGDAINVQPAYQVPDCSCGDECSGPEPVPWLSWKHCFKFFEFRNSVLAGPTTEKLRVGRLEIRVQYQHILCLLGRKQGPMVHSLTLLPKEQISIFEYDRYRHATAVTDRFSVRTSFFQMTQKVQDAFSSNKSDSGASVSATSGVSGGGSAGINLGIVSIGGGASASSSNHSSSYFDVASVSQHFGHVAETSSMAVESERSIVVSTFEENESLRSMARTLRNDNDCKAVTYYIRRVFEVYKLSTTIVGIQALVGGLWVDLLALPKDVQALVERQLEGIKSGLSHDPGVEISLPTDGLLYEAELAHCSSCDCEREAKMRLEMERMQIENLNLRLEAERRQKLLDSGDLHPFALLQVVEDEV